MNIESKVGKPSNGTLRENLGRCNCSSSVTTTDFNSSWRRRYALYREPF